MTYLQAIRQYCIQCRGGGAILEVMKCDNEQCPLYDYRCGTDPSTNKKELADRINNKQLYDDCIPE